MSETDPTSVERIQGCRDVMLGSRNAFYTLTYEDTFQVFCDEQAQARDGTTRAFWQAAADFVGLPEWQVLTQPNDETSQAFMAAFATLPSFVYAQYTLGQDRSKQTEGARLEAKRDASRFNSRVRDAVRQCPDLLVSAFLHIMGDALKDGMIYSKLQGKGHTYLEWMVPGIQHELAFEQMLRYTGRDFNRADTEDDIRGIDYRVAMHSGGYRNVDVTGARGRMGPRHAGVLPSYRIFDDKTVRILSLVSADEFEDMFVVPEALAAERAQVLDTLLDEIDQVG